MSFPIEGWEVTLISGTWVALLLNEDHEIKTYLYDKSLDCLIVKIDQFNHPERCSS